MSPHEELETPLTILTFNVNNLTNEGVIWWIYTAL